MGVFASAPPTNFGAMKAYTSSTKRRSKNVPFKALPPSNKSESMPCLPNCSNKFHTSTFPSHAMQCINAVRLSAPVQEGQVIIPNLLDTGVDLVACRDLPCAE